jgi:hypothetical protein
MWEIYSRDPELKAYGRPPRRRDFHRQYDLNPARCHLITVSGFTIAKAPSTFGAKRYKPANIRRSSIPNVGRFGDFRVSLAGYGPLNEFSGSSFQSTDGLLKRK